MVFCKGPKGNCLLLFSWQPKALGCRGDSGKGSGVLLSLPLASTVRICSANFLQSVSEVCGKKPILRCKILLYLESLRGLDSLLSPYLVFTNMLYVLFLILPRVLLHLP